MTQEEKAKAYDEVLKKARMFYKDEHVDKEANSLLEVLFPELKESEDEKIRKEIVSAINIYCSEYHRGTKVRNDMLAWLEKQGEQKPYGQRQECVDCQFNYAGECKGSCAMKRGKQKPTEWSEEDDSNLERAIWYVENPAPKVVKDSILVEWLKSLKDRYTWEPSDEQMKALNYVVNLMASSESPKENDYYYNVFKDLKEQLKKLK
jgi:hypothetical protein